MLSNNEMLKIRASGVAVLMVLVGLVVLPTRILEISNEKVGDLAGQRGIVRFTDAKYVLSSTGNRIVLDKNAPVSQWPHAVKIYCDAHSNLQVTVFHPTPEPTHFDQAVVQ